MEIKIENFKKSIGYWTPFSWGNYHIERNIISAGDTQSNLCSINRYYTY